MDTFALPFGIGAQPASLSKKAALKLDFDLSPQAVKLADIFPGMMMTFRNSF
jgi:hypothetical protein